MDDLTSNGWNFTEHRDDYLPTPPPCPPSPDCPCPPPRPLPPMPPMPGCPPRPCPPDPCQNRTPNYGLPLWKASDVTSWLMQMNGAMLRIDNIMHDLALRTGINGLPDDLVTTVSKLCQDVAVLNCTVGELSNKQANQDLLMQNMNTQFSAMKTDIASLQLSITNLDTRVMTVDSANQQNRNDITLIKSDLNMLSKTVTNLSSNLTQFQNATNQTLATLQASVDAIEDWMVNPSGSLETVFHHQFTVEDIGTTITINEPTINTLMDTGRTSGKHCSITVRKVVGDIAEMYLYTGEHFVVKTTDTRYFGHGKITIPVEGIGIIGTISNRCFALMVIEAEESTTTTGIYVNKGGTSKAIPAMVNFFDGKFEFLFNWGQTTDSNAFKANTPYILQAVTISALVRLASSEASSLPLLEQGDVVYEGNYLEVQ